MKLSNEIQIRIITNNFVKWGFENPDTGQWSQDALAFSITYLFNQIGWFLTQR